MDMNSNYSELINNIYSGQNITSHNNYEYNYEYIIDNIDNSVSSVCTETSEDVNNVINIKNNIINILSNNEYDSFPNNSGSDINGSTIESEDKLIKLNDLYDDFKNEYLEKQSQYFESEKNMNNMIKNAKTNIKKLDVVVDFMKTLDTEDCDDGLNSTIIENIKKYTEKLNDNDKLSEAKNNYTKMRIEMVKYLNVIKKLNSVNVTNTCPTCLTNPVNIYLNPCGHTLCDDCYNRISNDNERKCFLCRTRVMNKSPLYFS